MFVISAYVTSDWPFTRRRHFSYHSAWLEVHCVYLFRKSTWSAIKK